MYDNETNELAADISGIRIQSVFRFPDADPMPIICLFAVYAEDCVIDENGVYIICIPMKTR